MYRYLILAAAVLMQVCLGANYAWSTFVPALKSDYGLTITQTQTIFGTISLVLTCVMFFAGRLQDAVGPRIPSLIGGLIFGASYIAASFSSGSFARLEVLVGVGSGIGVGLAYLCPIACAVKWFPRHKSLVTGIAVAGFGASGIVVSRIGEHLLASGHNVLYIFRWLGIGYLVVVCLTALVLKNPPGGAACAPSATIDLRALLRDRNFWGLVCGFFPGLCVGLSTIGNIKPFGLSLGLGISAVAAGAAVSFLALCNALGRLSWGVIGQYIGGRRAILASLTGAGLVCLAGPWLISGPVSLQVFAVLTGFNYGACLVLYATEIAHHYGADCMGTVYSTLFLTNGIAGFCAPTLAGKLYDTTGTYLPAFSLFGAVALCGVVLFYCIYRPVKVSPTP
jgi:OFA family oxalate/formate antiporter-like MFS transporter